MLIKKYWIYSLFLLLCFTAQSQPPANACIDSVVVYNLQSPLTGLKMYSRLPLANGDVLIYNIVHSSYSYSSNTFYNDTSREDYIMRLDSNGHFKQGCKIKIANNTGNAQRFHFAAASPDGGFALGGERYKIASDFTSFYHVVCLRFDANMNLVWQKEILPLPNPNFATTRPLHIKTMGFSPDNRILFSVNFNNPEFGDLPLPIPGQPYTLLGTNHNFFFALDLQGNVQWSKRVSFGGGMLGVGYWPINTASVLFNGNEAFFYGEAIVPAGTQIKYGLYKIGLNYTNGQTTGARLSLLPNGRVMPITYAYLFENQRAIAFPLAGNTHSVVFREIYKNTNNATVCNFANVEIDLAGNILSARYIQRAATYSDNQLFILTHGLPECAVDKNNTLAFFDRGVNTKKLAVVNSRNETLTIKSLAATPTNNSELNTIDFIRGGNEISVHVTDSTGTATSQQVTAPVYVPDLRSSCLNTDSSFFTVSPIALTANILPIDSTRENVFSAVDLAVNVLPYSFTRAEVCKQVSICTSIKIAGDTVACVGQVYQFRAAKNTGCYQKINWVVDTSRFSIVQATDTLLLLSARRSGNTVVKANLGGCQFTDSIVVAVYQSARPFSLGADTALCSNNGLPLRLPLGLRRYQWSTGDTTAQITISAAGIYWGKVWDACGNTFTDTITIQKFATPVVSLGRDTSLCEGTSYYLNAGNQFTQYRWSNGAATSQIPVTAAGAYWVRITDSNGCQAADTVSINAIYPSPTIALADIAERCIAQNDTLFAGLGYSRYLWQDGSTQPTYKITRPGLYWATVTNQQGCSKSDTTQVTKLVPKPGNFITGDSVLCLGIKGVLRTNRLFQKYLWSGGSTGSALTIQSPGWYRLFVADPSGCTGVDSIFVKPIDCKDFIYFPSAFTPNGDGLNDIYKPAVIGLLQSYTLVIYNRYGEKILKRSGHP